jgi:hypothetical protein
MSLADETDRLSRNVGGLLDDGTDVLSRNIANQLPKYAAEHRRREMASVRRLITMLPGACYWILCTSHFKMHINIIHLRLSFTRCLSK